MKLKRQVKSKVSANAYIFNSAISYWVDPPCKEKLISLNLAYTVQSNDLLNTKNFCETNGNYKVNKFKTKKHTILPFDTFNRYSCLQDCGNFSAGIESMNNSSPAHCTAGGNSESKKEIAQEIGQYLAKLNLTHLTKRRRNCFLRNFNFWQKYPGKKKKHNAENIL